jgi:hypothetical protein
LIYKLPDIDPTATTTSKSDEEIKNIYRKFFAEMRLNRLQYHMLLLEFFVGNCTKEEVISSIQSSIDFMDKIGLWIDNLKENGKYEEFKKTCKDEIKAIDVIIQTYEDRMRKANIQ